MKDVIVKKLEKKRFDVLIALSRSPFTDFFCRELEYFSNLKETILGIVLLDIIDYDYAAIVLARDEGKRFRAIQLITSLPTHENARNWLINEITKITEDGLEVFPQGDEDGEKIGVDLFTQIVTDEKLHPYFKILNNDIAFIPAKTVIRETMHHFIDIDGNFVEQFQSSGFDSRAWELYLNLYFAEEHLFINREFDRPDFLVEKYGKKVFIEAVTVGRKEDNPPKFYDPIEFNKLLNINFKKEIENLMPIRFGSPLYSKLQKKYWDLKHVAGNPIVFAIADFHDDFSMLWSSNALISYLYGIKHEFHYDKNNQLIIDPAKIETHKNGKKEIPSGFFFQPDSEKISAVLFSSSGTIPKFNRMGKQAGYGGKNIKMMRFGTCYDNTPNASLPKMFNYEIDEKCNETWSEGLEMFHNPNAIYPVPEELFPSIAHHHFENGQIKSFIPTFHPFSSMTFHIKIIE